jgi:hypothetical protein
MDRLKDEAHLITLSVGLLNFVLPFCRLRVDNLFTLVAFLPTMIWRAHLEEQALGSGLQVLFHRLFPPLLRLQDEKDS